LSNENSIKKRKSSTADLKHDHLTIKRVGAIAQRCSDKLYADDDIPIEDIEILSVVMEEFIDAFHHGKEEKAYFPVTKNKDGYSEDIRKFLIEHELGRRIANMLRRELQILKKSYNLTTTTHSMQDRTEIKGKKEPVARFLKSYVVFIDDHTGKEDIFFDLIENKQSISNDEDRALLQHYEACKNDAGGQVRIEEMMRLIEYLENRDWMKGGE
jgi:hemerythrin-like domain-containing protein